MGPSSRCAGSPALALALVLPGPRQVVATYSYRLCVNCSLAISVLRYLFQTSLVVQWIKICQPMPGTGVRALVQEGSTYLGTNKTVCHNY